MTESVKKKKNVLKKTHLLLNDDPNELPTVLGLASALFQLLSYSQTLPQSHSQPHCWMMLLN